MRLPLFLAVALTFLVLVPNATAKTPADTIAVSRFISPPGRMTRLRADVGSGAVRLRIGSDMCTLESARFDSRGVSFAPGVEEDLPRGTHAETRSPARLTSPVGWERIRSVDVKRSSTWRGAFAGGVLAPMAVYVLSASGPRDFTAGLYMPAVVLTGALAGGLVGALIPRWERVWTSGER